MDDGSDCSNDIDGSRRRVLRISGAVAGALSAVGLSGTAAGGPLVPGGERLPFDGEPVGEPHPACEDPPPETGASDPNERHLQLVAEQIRLRGDNRPKMDEDAIRSVLRDRNAAFDDHLIFFAANDFGQPRVFLPEALEDQDTALQAILDRVHERKWRGDDPDLRDVRHRMFEEVRGIHKGLPALYRDDGSAEYDIVYGWYGVYNFGTIRQVVGLVDWVTNAEEPWLDGLRLTYSSQ